MSDERTSTLQRQLSIAFLIILAGCPGKPAPPEPPVEVAPVASAEVAPVDTRALFSDAGSFVPLDVVDHMAMPEELAQKIAALRARIPERISDDEKKALEELEHRYQLEEQKLEGMEEDRARLLGLYYWERFRIFAPELPEEPPPELLGVFSRK
jgi:hypothetical protein